MEIFGVRRKWEVLCYDFYFILLGGKEKCMLVLVNGDQPIML